MVDCDCTAYSRLLIERGWRGRLSCPATSVGIHDRDARSCDVTSIYQLISHLRKCSDSIPFHALPFQCNCRVCSSMHKKNPIIASCVEIAPGIHVLEEERHPCDTCLRRHLGTSQPCIPYSITGGKETRIRRKFEKLAQVTVSRETKK